MEKEKLFEYILAQDREALSPWLDELWRTSDEWTRKKLFFYWEHRKAQELLTPETLTQRVLDFEKDSRTKKYYHEFEMNSKNYSWKSPQAFAWSDTMASLLDDTCTIAFKGHYEAAKNCMAILFQLLETPWEYFFSHDGDPGLVTKHNYHAAWDALQENREVTADMMDIKPWYWGR